MLADVVQRNGATAGSLDGWEWRELKVVPVAWYDELESLRAHGLRWLTRGVRLGTTTCTMSTLLSGTMSTSAFVGAKSESGACHKRRKVTACSSGIVEAPPLQLEEFSTPQETSEN